MYSLCSRELGSVFQNHAFQWSAFCFNLHTATCWQINVFSSDNPIFKLNILNLLCHVTDESTDPAPRCFTMLMRGDCNITTLQSGQDLTGDSLLPCSCDLLELIVLMWLVREYRHGLWSDGYQRTPDRHSESLDHWRPMRVPTIVWTLYTRFTNSL